MVKTLVKNLLKSRTIPWVYNEKDNEFGAYVAKGETIVILGGYPIAIPLMSESLVRQMGDEIKAKAVEVSYYVDGPLVDTLEVSTEPTIEKEEVKEEVKKEVLTNQTIEQVTEYISEHDKKASKLREENYKGFVPASIDDLKYDTLPIMEDPSKSVKERQKELSANPKKVDLSQVMEGVVDKEGVLKKEPTLKMKKTTLQKYATKLKVDFVPLDTKQDLIDKITKQFN